MDLFTELRVLYLKMWELTHPEESRRLKQILEEQHDQMLEKIKQRAKELNR